MGYAAAALALLGITVGALFRLQILLLVVGLVFLISIALSISSGFTFVHTALTVMVAQTILQGCYFLGSVARAFFSTDDAHHML
jgi:hypothetical protein